MQIFPDSRAICHFGNNPEEGIYTLIFPSNHSLKQRYDALQYICAEVLLGMKQEEAKAKEDADKKAAEEKPAEEIKENTVVEENTTETAD